MTPADWRALLDAYLDGRLSAEAFMRRFIEGWQAGAPLPRAIGDLRVSIEAFEADVRAAGEDGAVADDDLRQAARRARANFGEEETLGVHPHTFDRTRAREEMARFQIGANRVLGAGCLIAAVWIALCVLQINYVIEWIHANAIDNVWLSSLVGFVLAWVPIIGNALAFAGATQGGWPVWLAAIVFFAAPAATFLSGWSRWRRRT